MQTDTNKISVHFITTLLGMVATGFVLYIAKPVFVPFFLAVLLFFMLQPMVFFLSRRGIPKGITASVLVLLIFLLGCFIGFLLFAALRNFVRDLPTYLARFGILYNQFQQYVMEMVNIDLSTVIDYNNLSNVIGNSLYSVSGNFMGIIANFLVVLFILLFLLLEERFFYARVHKALERSRARRTVIAIGHISRQIGRYLATKFIISGLTALTVFIVLLLLQVRLALLWALLTFLFNFIPYVGSIIISIISLIFIAIQFFPDGQPVLIATIALFIIHTIYGNIIEPRLIGRSMGVSSLVVVISLLVWGWMWGLAGTFMAVPMLAMIHIVLMHIPSLRFIAIFMNRGGN